MSWLRLDDQIAFHAKTIAAGNEAFGAWVRLNAWSCAQLTDGFVTDSVARSMCSKTVLSKLVEVRFLDVEPGGFRVHDFLDWNPKAADVRARRDADKSRKARGRDGQVRSESGRMSARNPNGKSAPSTGPVLDPNPNPVLDPTEDPPVVPPAGDEPEGVRTPGVDRSKTLDSTHGPAIEMAPSSAENSCEPLQKSTRGSKADRAKRGTRCPSSTAPEALTFGATHGLPSTPEVAAFLDFHAGKGTVALDWPATWRTWQRNAARFGRATPTSPTLPRRELQQPAAPGRAAYTPASGLSPEDALNPEIPQR